MKRTVILLLSLFFCLSCAALADDLLGEGTVDAKLVFTEATYEIVVNGSVTIHPDCVGRQIDRNTRFSYSSSDETVAIVYSSGVVMGKGAGNATITVTATFADGGLLSGEVMVKVKVPVKFITVPTKAVKVSKGETLSVAELVSVNPANASDKRLKYTVSDESIATIDASGCLTPIKGGTVKVTVTSMEETRSPASAFFQVTVLESAGSVILDRDEYTVRKGQLISLEATVLPASATDKRVIWSSADPSIATVYSTGRVAGVSSGTTTITATAADGSGVYATAKVNVIVSVTAVNLTSRTESVVLGQTLDVGELVLVYPENATCKAVSYVVSDESVATIDENGILTTACYGTVKVTVTSDEDTNYPKSAILTVNVCVPVGYVAIDGEAFSVENGGRHALKVTVGPDNAADKRVIWSSADPEIATVSAAGVVEGVSNGSTVITAIAADGSGCSDSVTVNVVTRVTDISFRINGSMVEEIILVEGDTALPEAIALPVEASNKSVKWDTNDPEVCFFDENGVLTGVREGTGSITATALDGSGVSSSIMVYVEPVEPVRVESIYWKTNDDVRDDIMGVKATSFCSRGIIQTIDYNVECIGENGTQTAEYRYDGPCIEPGNSSKSAGFVQGFSSACTVRITVIRVYFTDGTVYMVPEEERVTVTLDL